MKKVLFAGLLMLAMTTSAIAAEPPVKASGEVFTLAELDDPNTVIDYSITRSSLASADSAGRPQSTPAQCEVGEDVLEAAVVTGMKDAGSARIREFVARNVARFLELIKTLQNF